MNTRRDSKYIKHLPFFQVFIQPKRKISAKNKSKFDPRIQRIYRSSNVDKHRIKLQRRGEELGRNPIIRKDGCPLNKNHRLERLLNLFSLDLSPLVGRLFLPPDRARGAHSSGRQPDEKPSASLVELAATKGRDYVIMRMLSDDLERFERYISASTLSFYRQINLILPHFGKFGPFWLFLFKDKIEISEIKTSLKRF